VHRSAMYSGRIEGIGPRYCPSIEDKVVKFPDKSQHQFFLEPEGLNTHEVYINGMSTSLPMEVQWQMVHSIPGLDEAELLRPGYAIEYDSVDATELDRSLRVKSMEGLYLAGQINGTSGYEEAACQGIMAGINAPLWLIGDEAWAEYVQKQARMAALAALLSTTKVDHAKLAQAGFGELTATAGLTWAQLLKRPEVTIEPLLAALRDDLATNPLLTAWAQDVAPVSRPAVVATSTSPPDPSISR